MPRIRIPLASSRSWIAFVSIRQGLTLRAANADIPMRFTLSKSRGNPKPKIVALLDDVCGDTD